MKMVKSMVEDFGVDPKHIDPYGNTCREKAELYLHSDIADYLKEQELKLKRGQLKVGMFDTYQRSGKNRCRLDY
jgi:hypothetical protein